MNEEEINNEEEVKEPSPDMSTDVMEAALGDDYVEIDEELIVVASYDDDDDIDLAFSQSDPRDWY